MPEATPDKKSEELFDRKFVSAALAIGVGYAVVVVLLGRFIGKEAASVAAVALTGLAAAIFKRFESLRFEPIDEATLRSVEVPYIGSWFVVLLTLGTLGLQLYLGLAFAFFIRTESAINWFTDNVWPQVVLASLAYFLAGFLAGRTAPRVKLSYAALAAFYAHVINVGIEVANWYEANKWGVPPMINALYALPLYLVVAVLGMWFAVRNKRGDRAAANPGPQPDGTAGAAPHG